MEKRKLIWWEISISTTHLVTKMKKEITQVLELIVLPENKFVLFDTIE
tara:strand:- start:1556 stop:1699 length:144 start_codon:yes stop_codon:yes gene_type:complete